MDLGINGKVALVSGAAGGLGRAMALALAEAGARVATCDINTGALTKLAEEASADGLYLHPFPLDLSKLDKVEETLEKIKQDIGPIDILVNNTGGPPPGKIAELSPESWRDWFEAMVLPVFRMTDLVIGGMRSRGWGRIITSTSSGVVAPIPNLGLSNSLRSTLTGWSKTLSREVARDGVTVNVVLPGRIATQRITQLDEARARRESRSVEEVVEESAATIPVGRYGRPKEYGNVVAFVASARASYITGSIIRVDGGLISSI